MDVIIIFDNIIKTKSINTSIHIKSPMQSIEFMQILRESEKSVFTMNDIAKIINKDLEYSRLYIHRLKKKAS